MSKQNYILLGVLAIIVIAMVAILASNYFINDGNAPNNGTADNGQPQEATISVTDRANTTNLGDVETNPFQKIIVDPFKVDQGETQKIIVGVDPKVKNVSVVLKDESGETQKELETRIFKGGEVYYSEWEPKNIVPGKRYSIELKATTESMASHNLSVGWVAKQ